MPIPADDLTDKNRVFAYIANPGGNYDRIAKAYGWTVAKFDFVVPLAEWVEKVGYTYEIDLDCSQDPCKAYAQKLKNGQEVAKKFIGELPKT